MHRRASRRAVRRLIAGVAVSSFGNGLTLPFTLILLSEVRGIALPTVGLLLAVPGVVGLLAVPVSGTLVDRLGPGSVLRVAIVAAGRRERRARRRRRPRARRCRPSCCSAWGSGRRSRRPARCSPAWCAEPSEVARAFGVQFTVLNASIGLGGLAAAAVVDVDRPVTFVVLYLGNAVTCLVYALLLPRPAPQRVPEAHEEQPRYREVLADPVFRRVCVVSLLFALTGYSALDGGVPAFARVVGSVSPQAVALLFAVNTAVIVGGQLAVLRLLRDAGGAAPRWRGPRWSGRRPGRCCSPCPSCRPAGRVAAVLAYGGVFGLGETLMAPVLGPLVNALATDRLRGRYNATQGATFSRRLRRRARRLRRCSSAPGSVWRGSWRSSPAACCRRRSPCGCAAG